MMVVRNEATGQDCVLTIHAAQRFRQMDGHHTDNIEASLRRAVPFGAQVGDGLLLLDGDVVFATRRDRNNVRSPKRIVTTVMTKAMAAGNFQAAGLARGALTVVNGKTAVSSQAAREAADNKMIADLAREQKTIHNLDDAALDARLQEVIEERSHQSGNVRKAYGRLWNEIIREQAGRRRRNTRKQTDDLCRRPAK